MRSALRAGAAQQRDGDYFGQPLNRVARLCAVGHGGQILLSNAAQELMRDALPKGAQLRDLGEHRLKDLARPLASFSADEEQPWDRWLGLDILRIAVFVWVGASLVAFQRFGWPAAAVVSAAGVAVAIWRYAKR